MKKARAFLKKWPHSIFSVVLALVLAALCILMMTSNPMAMRLASSWLFVGSIWFILSAAVFIVGYRQDKNDQRLDAKYEELNRHEVENQQKRIRPKLTVLPGGLK